MLTFSRAHQAPETRATSRISTARLTQLCPSVMSTWSTTATLLSMDMDTVGMDMVVDMAVDTDMDVVMDTVATATIMDTGMAMVIAEEDTVDTGMVIVDTATTIKHDTHIAQKTKAGHQTIDSYTQC